MKEFEPTLFHLREANEEIEELILEMNAGPIDADVFKIWMAHIYHHVNSAWNTRFVTSLDDPILHENFHEFATHPTDIVAWEV